MSKTVDTLRARLDAFSRQLNAKIREFKATGELESKVETIEILRKRQEALKTQLDRAIRAGAVSDMLKTKTKRSLVRPVRSFSNRPKRQRTLILCQRYAGPLLAQSRHELVHCTCPLSGVKRTLAAPTSALPISICSGAILTSRSLLSNAVLCCPGAAPLRFERDPFATAQKILSKSDA
jgi:hypothetical protein